MDFDANVTFSFVGKRFEPIGIKSPYSIFTVEACVVPLAYVISASVMRALAASVVQSIDSLLAVNVIWRLPCCAMSALKMARSVSVSSFFAGWKSSFQKRACRE